jgi:dTDP-4-dehydrorhamnose 3,5-epimerase
MNVIASSLPGVSIIEPQVFGDHRGFFLESYQRRRYQDHGIDAAFVQDNISSSVQNTLRGLHYQYPRGQAKLVQVLQGEIYDVAVDIRKGSPTQGQWVGVVLSSENKRQVFIPEGFAHGFCVLSKTALFMYKCSEYYIPEDEGGVRWNDSHLAIKWPVKNPVMSERDQCFSDLMDIPADRLPVY